MILSLGDILDRLIIENLKVFNMRQQLHNNDLSDEEHVKLYESMNIINKNREILIQELDEKFQRVVNKEEKNRVLNILKTY